ncbi:hypothetical protein OG533_39635 (plasmid) [Streptomyces sp. NBC_01186]|uniref:hypothetical protein n=1 Tax=Streptomyces sp. NBC_01186 TaxID=2903765 RepID=UPI002E155A35|nr:hypothetical protein OG533_39635 [Streptomyces sp. NBC_01186]
MDDRPIGSPPGTLAIIAHLIDTLPEYGNTPQAAARDPYLRARWAATPEQDRCTALLETAVAARDPVCASWRASARYARRLQRHAARHHRDAGPDRLRESMPEPPSLHTGLAAALVLFAALGREPHAPPRTPPPPEFWTQVLYLTVLGTLIALLARGVTR